MIFQNISVTNIFWSLLSNKLLGKEFEIIGEKIFRMILCQTFVVFGHYYGLHVIRHKLEAIFFELFVSEFSSAGEDGTDVVFGDEWFNPYGEILLFGVA